VCSKEEKVEKLMPNVKTYFYVPGGESVLARCKVNKKQSPIKFLMDCCIEHAKGDYIDLVTYISAKTPSPSAAEN
jgi:hypothetical protein